MENSIDLSTVLALAGAISAIGGAWLTVRKLNSDYKKQRDLEAAQLLQEAKEEINKVKAEINSEKTLLTKEFQGQLDSVRQDLQVHKESVNKDLDHLRETYNNEIRNLGKKIEELRIEVRNHHDQLIGLLTKMIENKD